MEETITLQAQDFAAVRKNVAEEPREGELPAAIEYSGAHGPVSCFYRVTLTPEAMQRLPECTALKLQEVKQEWTAILYTPENRLTCPFAQAEMDALCAAWDIVLVK